MSEPEGQKRKRKKLDEELFRIDDKKTKATCKICGKELSSIRNFCFVRHYLAHHKEASAELGLVDDGADGGEDTSGEVEAKESKISIKISKNTYSRSLVELVTVNGLPLSVLDCPALRRILDPIEKGFNNKAKASAKASAKTFETIDSRTIKPILSKIARKIKTRIMNEVKGKMVCLKLDIATRMDRDVLGVNVQFSDRNTIKTRTLAIVELKQRHTAEYIKTEVLKILSSFGISIAAVYTTTTDNGSNVVAATRLLRNEQSIEFLKLLEKELNVNINDQSLTVSDDTDSENGDDHNDTNVSADEEPEEQPILSEERINALMPVLSGIRCAAHTVQLAVSDTLKALQYKKHLKTMKSYVKKLRKMPYKNLFKLNKKNKPKLSCDTRWNSDFDMAKSLLDEKSFIQSITKGDKDCVLSDSEWEFIEQFIEAFEPVKQLTTSLQSEQLTFGDFYLLWVRCKLTLEKQNTGMAKKLLEHMVKREPALTMNKAFLAAIFVDQRINYRNSPLITEDQKAIGLEHLKNTWNAMQRVSQGNVEQTTTDPMDGPSSAVDDVLETFLLEHETSGNDSMSTDVFNQLEDLSRLPRLKLEKGQSILDHWYRQKSATPELYELATLVLSSPATQVSVERAFSALALILTKLRSRLGEDTLSDILVIKLNGDLLKFVEF